MNALLIVNPAAGQGKPQDALDTMQAALAPVLGKVVVTQKAGDAERAARTAAGRGFDAVLVAGGDGTVNEAVNGLLTAPNANVPLPLGLVPLGTQNVLAHEMGLALPLGEFGRVSACLQAGKTRHLDVGQAGTRYFALMAGFGFDAAVVRYVRGAVKNWVGPAAYALALVETLAKYESTEITLTLDGETVRSEAFLVVVANAASYAYRKVKLAPFAAPDDGWLDVCVFERPKTGRDFDRVGFAAQMASALVSRHLNGLGVRYYRAKQIALSSSPPISGQLDGEAFGETPVSIRVVPSALTVFVP